MSRTASWFPAAILLGLALLAAPVSAQSLPPDCLAAGTISDAGVVLQRANDILTALGAADASLRAGLGSLIRNPDLDGVDLSAPIRFFYMNPRIFPRPWVYQFGVTDAEVLKRALAADGPAAQEDKVELRLDGRQAIWSLDAKAAEVVIRWQKSGGKPPDFRVAGQVQARLDMQGLLRAFDADFDAQLLLMKDRAREALEAGGRKDLAVKQEISAVQAQLDSTAAGLRQVRDADFALEFGPTYVRAGLDARLADSAPLRALFAAQTPGDLGLLGLCPAQAGVAVVNNLSFVGAAGRMFLNMAGLPSPEKPGQRRGSGYRAIALFLSQQWGVPTGPARVEILDLRDGDAAVEARQEWDRLARPAAEPAIPDQFGGEPFSLHPAEAGLPAPEGVRLAKVVPNEAALQPKGLAAFRRFLGSHVDAAQERRGEICLTAIGGYPMDRLRQADAVAEGKKDSLPASPVFQKSTASLPEKPNLLVYVSPDALRRWFALAGRVALGPIHADAMGLAAGLRLDGDGARFVLNFPTADIPGAK